VNNLYPLNATYTVFIDDVEVDNGTIKALSSSLVSGEVEGLAAGEHTLRVKSLIDIGTFPDRSIATEGVIFKIE
jgi:hypothetical protein